MPKGLFFQNKITNMIISNIFVINHLPLDVVQIWSSKSPAPFFCLHLQANSNTLLQKKMPNCRQQFHLLIEARILQFWLKRQFAELAKVDFGASAAPIWISAYLSNSEQGQILIINRESIMPGLVASVYLRKCKKGSKLRNEKNIPRPHSATTKRWNDTDNESISDGQNRFRCICVQNDEWAVGGVLQCCHKESLRTDFKSNRLIFPTWNRARIFLLDR